MGPESGAVGTCVCGSQQASWRIGRVTSVWASESTPSHVTARKPGGADSPRGLSRVMRHRLGDM